MLLKTYYHGITVTINALSSIIPLYSSMFSQNYILIYSGIRECNFLRTSKYFSYLTHFGEYSPISYKAFLNLVYKGDYSYCVFISDSVIIRRKVFSIANASWGYNEDTMRIPWVYHDGIAEVIRKPDRDICSVLAISNIIFVFFYSNWLFDFWIIV